MKVHVQHIPGIFRLHSDFWGYGAPLLENGCGYKANATSHKYTVNPDLPLECEALNAFIANVCQLINICRYCRVC